MPKRENVFQIRLDDELADAAKAKAKSYGGLNLSAVVRALLRKWSEHGAALISLEEIAAEAERAPKSPRKKKAKAR